MAIAPRADEEPTPERSTQAVNLVFLLADALRRQGDALTEQFGLSTSRWLIAGALKDGPLSSAAVARKRGLTRQSVRESAARLERDGLISRARNPDDARAPLLALTPLGWEVLDRIEPVRRRWAEEADGVLSDEHWRITLQSLSRLAAHLDGASRGTTSASTDASPSPI